VSVKSGSRICATRGGSWAPPVAKQEDGLRELKECGSIDRRMRVETAGSENECPKVSCFRGENLCLGESVESLRTCSNA
jgi:hypothetical protein